MWNFMGEHPFLTFFLASLVLSAFYGVVIKLPNIIMRHANIRKHGYPPPHCDADGDFRPEPDDNEDEDE